MTALQDWLSFRPVVNQSAIREFVCRPFRAVMAVSRPERNEFTVMGEGAERC